MPTEPDGLLLPLDQGEDAVDPRVLVEDFAAPLVGAGGSWAIHEGDALELLRAWPSASVDALVTDPPYAAMGESASQMQKGRSHVRRETQFYEAWIREHLAQWARVLKPTGALWLTLDWRGAMALDAAAGKLGLTSPSIGVWSREGLGMGYVLRKTYETFAVLPMPDWQRRRTDVPDVWSHKWTPTDRKLGHSAEKPVALLLRALRLITSPGELVLDPFVGTGTTGVAALRFGARFVGFEQEPDLAQLARVRLAGEGQGPLFAQGPREPLKTLRDLVEAAPHAPKPPELLT